MRVLTKAKDVADSCRSLITRSSSSIQILKKPCAMSDKSVENKFGLKRHFQSEGSEIKHTMLTKYPYEAEHKYCRSYQHISC